MLCVRLELVTISKKTMPKGHPNWGGYREGSGQKPKWRAGETKPIRLPVALHEKIYQYVLLLDSGEGADTEFLCCDIKPHFEPVTESKKESVTLSSLLKEFVATWKIRVSEGKGPRWDKARKMLAELEALLAQDT